MKTFQRIFASPFGLGLFAVMMAITFVILTDLSRTDLTSQQESKLPDSPILRPWMVLGYRVQNVFYKPRVCIKVKGEDGWLKGYFRDKGNYFYDFVVTEPKEKEGMIVIGKDEYVEGDFCT